MNGKRYTPEQIIHKLREVEVALSKGATIAQAALEFAVRTARSRTCESRKGGDGDSLGARRGS